MENPIQNNKKTSEISLEAFQRHLLGLTNQEQLDEFLIKIMEVVSSCSLEIEDEFLGMLRIINTLLFYLLY